jgi:hypothetical protein
MILNFFAIVQHALDPRSLQDPRHFCGNMTTGLAIGTLRGPGRRKPGSENVISSGSLTNKGP